MAIMKIGCCFALVDDRTIGEIHLISFVPEAALDPVPLLRASYGGMVLVGCALGVRYGLGVLGAAVQFRLHHLGIGQPRFLATEGRRLDPIDEPADAGDRYIPAARPAGSNG